MNKKHLSLHCRTLSLLCLAGGALTVASCAQDGFTDEKFDGGVYNTQLEAPSVDDIKVTASTDGTMQTISWPVVYGAGGYHAVLTNTDAGTVVKDTIIDGISFATSRLEDTNYQVSLTVLGNEERGNTGTDAVIKTYNTFTASYGSIPNNTDLTEWFTSNPLPSDYDGDLAFDLEPNGTYTMSGVVDFSNKYVILRATGNNATITCADGACFKFGNGIKLQNLNIDFTDNTANAVLLMSEKTEEFTAQSTEALGYKAAGANQNGYVMLNPVTLKNVNVKNVKKSLIYGNKTPWSLTSLVIDGCMVQLDNESSMGVINMYQGSNGLIKDLVVKNSTFFNLKDNETGYFLRYANASNAQPQKIFGTGATAALTLSNNTFANCFNKKDFANNLPNTGAITTTLTNNIFYDVYRVYQIVQTNTVRTTTNNYVWWVVTSRQTNDITRTDSNGNPICTEADPGFAAPSTYTALDFSAANCGANFTPSGVPADNKAGDPRWLTAE